MRSIVDLFQVCYQEHSEEPTKPPELVKPIFCAEDSVLLSIAPVNDPPFLDRHHAVVHREVVGNQAVVVNVHHGEVGLLLTRTESLRTTVSEEATRLLIAAFLVTSTSEIISRLSTLWRV